MPRRPNDQPDPSVEERRNARVVLNRLKKRYPESPEAQAGTPTHP